MTPDRKTLIEFVYGEMYERRCPCGRCDCVSSDPFRIAARLLISWSVTYRTLSEHESRRAELFRGFAKKAKRSRNPGIRGRLAEHERNAETHERNARRFAQASLRFERLGCGRKPFASDSERSKSDG